MPKCLSSLTDIDKLSRHFGMLLKCPKNDLQLMPVEVQYDIDFIGWLC